MSDEAPVPVPSPAPAHHDVPGMRLMAVVRWILLIALAGLAFGTWWRLGPGTEESAGGIAKFYCPMHPQIQSPNPGTCPICFMNLEPIPAGGAVPAGDAASAAPSASEPSSMPGADVMLTLERRQAVGIATTKVARRMIARELRLPAVIEAPQSAVAEVRIRSAGYVEYVAPIEIGAKVKAGEMLAAIFAPEILRSQEELLAAQAMAAEAGKSEDHGADQQMVEAARRRLELLGVGRRTSDRILADGKSSRAIGVSAPRAGIVTARNIWAGGYVTPETTLFQITDLSKLWVSATVGTEELKALPPKTPGRFAPRGGSPLDVEVLLVEPSVGGQTRSATVRFSVANDAGALRPGEIGEVLVSLPAAERLIVPRDAVIDTGMHQYVFVEKSAGLFSPRAVVAGPMMGNGRVIESGLEPEAVIVTRGAFLLDSESRLQGALAPAATSSPSAP
ncbi:MAG: efflux RND transporter periplasmic adaptor subunit [Polyangiaceae bacterium]|nr:efflux RND transporter periplasmic adaptor subunit [Polyangiaceae bacterium]